MPRILFVDDDEYVLSGLKRMLRSMRDEWEMTFVSSGKEAMAQIGQGFFDIVVSDLRMPRMNGVTLLREVRRASPETVRIALSGQACRGTNLRAASEIHQFIYKPCEPAVLEAVLRRVLELGKLLTDPRLKRLAGGMRSLPSLNAILDEVVEKLDQPDVSARDVGEMVAQDPGMSSKVLQLVNSAYVGTVHVISDPVQATALLGTEAIRTLLLSVRVFEYFTEKQLCNVSVNDVWRHSLEVAHVARQLLLIEGGSEYEGDCAFLGGLLHDVGKLVFAASDNADYGSVLRGAAGTTVSVAQLERFIMGGTHGEVGAYLMGLWGFAESTVHAIAHHHAPLDSPCSDFCAVTAVYVANVLSHTRDGEEDPSYVWNEAYLEQVGKSHRMELWNEVARQYERRDGSN